MSNTHNEQGNGCPTCAQLRAILRILFGEQRSPHLTTDDFKKGTDPDVDVCVALFHKACRTGLVDGARRRGRTWVAPRESWLAYRESVGRGRRGLRVVREAELLPEREPDVLEELGLRRHDR